MDANWEQQLKRIDAIGEQQLKWTQLGSSSSDRELSGGELLTKANKGEVAERAKLLIPKTLLAAIVDLAKLICCELTSWQLKVDLVTQSFHRNIVQKH